MSNQQHEYDTQLLHKLAGIAVKPRIDRFRTILRESGRFDSSSEAEEFVELANIIFKDGFINGYKAAALHLNMNPLGEWVASQKKAGPSARANQDPQTQLNGKITEGSTSFFGRLAKNLRKIFT